MERMVCVRVARGGVVIGLRMVYVAIILSLVLARFADVAPGGGGGLPAARFAWVPAISACVGACMMMAGAAWLAGRGLDRTGRVRWITRFSRVRVAAIVIAIAGLAHGVVVLGFDRAVRSVVGDLVLLDDLLIIAPVLVVLIAGWWSLYPLERRMREAMLMRTLATGGVVHAPPTRGAFVLSHVRHGLLLILLPVSLVIAWTDCVARLPAWTAGSSLHALAVRWEGGLHWLGIALTLVLGPALLRWLWDVHPLPEGELATWMRDACKAAKIRVRGPLVWRTHGTLVNGAILGLLWPFRYLLFTDAMLERLTSAQLEAVLAHEIAHVRLRHMLWLGIASGGAILMLSVLVDVCLTLLAPRLDVANAGGVLLLASVATLACGLLVFGAISRRFEWQADAFSARWLSRQEASATITMQAASTVAATLGAVADHNGIDPRAFSWRHGSIASRQRRVMALVDVPVHALPIDREALWIRVVGSLALGLGIVLLWLG